MVSNHDGRFDKMKLVILEVLVLSISVSKKVLGEIQEEYQLEVLKVDDVPFPGPSGGSAFFETNYEKEIPEFTVCYRYQIESYNPGWATLVHLGKWFDMLGFETGYEESGYQALGIVLFRNVPGGGIGNCAMPYGYHVNFPRNLPTGKWYNFCFAYSSILQRMLSYGNGLKITGHKFGDESEKPLLAGAFTR